MGDVHAGYQPQTCCGQINRSRREGSSARFCEEDEVEIVPHPPQFYPALPVSPPRYATAPPLRSLSPVLYSRPSPTVIAIVPALSTHGAMALLVCRVAQR